MKNKKKRILLAAAGVFVLAMIIVLIAKVGIQENKKKARIGIILSGSREETGWNSMHYNGAKEACDKLGAELLIRENIREDTGQCPEAVRALAEEKAEMIILSSYGYSREVKDLVKEYPDIAFYGISSEYHDKNLTSYFARMYQARYLAGIIAGLQTKTDHIGYVAAMPNNEVNRGINAFTLGVKRVNPDADVTVAWSGLWDDEEKEKKAAAGLIKRQADVLTYHQNQTYVSEAAEQAGIDSIGYHEAVSGFSDHYLTAAVWNLEILYEVIIRDFQQGKGNSVNNCWLGIEKGVVELSPYSGRISEEARQAVDEAKAEIIAGKDVFFGEIYDTDGTLRCGKDETIADGMLLEHFDWYVKGVVLYEENIEKN